MQNLKGSIKDSLLTTTKTAFYCLFVSTLFYFTESKLLIKLPITSGYLHSGGYHYLSNIVFIFLFLIPEINSGYRKSTKIFLVTSLIYLLYFPLPLLGIIQFAIGMSGTCFFLISRFFFSLNRIGKFIVAYLIISEVYSSLFEIDSISHTVHIIGISLGIFSLKK